VFKKKQSFLKEAMLLRIAKRFTFIKAKPILKRFIFLERTALLFTNVKRFTFTNALHL